MINEAENVVLDEENLNTTLEELLQVDKSEKYQDITIGFAHPDKPESVLDGTPPVRLLF